MSPNQSESRLDPETPEGDNEEDLTMEQKHDYQGLAIGFTLSYYKEKTLIRKQNSWNQDTPPRSQDLQRILRTEGKRLPPRR